MEEKVESRVKKPEPIPPKESLKKDEWTSLSVKRSTRDKINKLSDTKGMAVNDYLLFLSDRAQKIVPSQIVLNVSGVEYGIAAQMTDILYNNNIIDTPSPEKMMRFALLHLKENIQKSLQKQLEINQRNITS